MLTVSVLTEAVQYQLTFKDQNIKVNEWIRSYYFPTLRLDGKAIPTWCLLTIKPRVNKYRLKVSMYKSNNTKVIFPWFRFTTAFQITLGLFICKTFQRKVPWLHNRLEMQTSHETVCQYDNFKINLFLGMIFVSHQSDPQVSTISSLDSLRISLHGNRHFFHSVKRRNDKSTVYHHKQHFTRSLESFKS